MENLRLYRFGKREHICDLIHNGKLCLNPATTYAEEGLSKGAFDPEELRFEQELPESATFEAFSKESGESKGIIDVVNSSPMVSLSDYNYYVFCMTYKYMFDFYDEFHADTCLIINDPDRFVNQACKKIMKEIPGWLINAGTVHYKSRNAFYAFNPSYHDINYTKDAENFSHQCEIRIVCFPPEPVMNLERQIIDIGDLCEYTYITGTENPKHIIKSKYSKSSYSPFKCGELEQSTNEQKNKHFEHNIYWNNDEINGLPYSKCYVGIVPDTYEPGDNGGRWGADEIDTPVKYFNLEVWSPVDKFEATSFEELIRRLPVEESDLAQPLPPGIRMNLIGFTNSNELHLMEIIKDDQGKE